MYSIFAICIGASLGALLRWGLGNVLNRLLPALPPGTLVANLLGGYLVGVALMVFVRHPQLAPEWRLFFVTGFLGALTTFSTFSAEIVLLLQQGRWGWAMGGVAAHLAGSLLMTLAGMASYAGLRALFS